MVASSGRDLRRTAAIITGGASEQESARARAARSRFEAEGLTVAKVDALHWQVEGLSFWPETGLWRRIDGALGGDGVEGLIRAAKQARVARPGR